MLPRRILARLDFHRARARGTGISSPLSLLIFGFELYRAWVMNKATPVEVTGPHWLHTPQAPPFPA